MPHEDLTYGQNQQQMPTPRELVMVLFRQRRIFLWVFGLVCVATVIYAAFGTSYQAKMKILVRRGRADAPVSAGSNAPLDLTHLAITEEELNSEVELLKDEDILRGVVQQTGVAPHDWLKVLRFKEGREQQLERATQRLARNLKVEPIKKTNFIAITYAAGNPLVAERVLQTLAAQYLTKHRDVHRPNGEQPFFLQQVEDSKLRLEQSKLQLLRFSAQHGVVSASLQRDLTLQKLSEIDHAYRQTKIALAETEERAAELQKQIAALPQRTTTQIRTADNPELLKELKSNLLTLELRRTQLLTKFEPNHRLVAEVARQIEQAKSAIAAEGLAPVRDETTDRNARFDWAQSELQQAQVELQGLRARELATNTEEMSYKMAARRLGEDAVAQENLFENEKAALENYLLYVKKQEEARMNDALDERGIVNVTIAEPPVVPALPKSSAWMVVLLGFVAAGTVGTGAAFAADYLSTSFRDPDDVVACLRAPVLASLPRSNRRRLPA